MFMKTIRGKTVEAYPLTSAQQFMYFLSLGFGGPLALNICTGYYWEGESDKELLRASIEEAIERCDTMRLRFAEDCKYGTVQYIVSDSGIDIGYENYRDMSPEDAHNKVKAWSREPIDMFNKPLHTVKIMDMPGGLTGVYAKFHHLAMDGWSSKMFMSDVMAIYISKIGAGAYPKPMRSFTDAIKLDEEYKASPQLAADRQFWYNNFFNRPEPIFTDFITNNRLYLQRAEKGDETMRRALLNGGDAESKCVYYEMDAGRSDRIMNFCRDNDLSVSCVLMFALRTALSVFSRNEEDVSFKLMVNRRGTILEKKSGGSRFMFFPFRSVVGADKTFTEAVEIIEDAQNDVFRHSSLNGIEVLNMLHAATKSASLDETYDSLAFSYHPYIDTPAADRHMKETSRGIWYHNDVCLANLYLTVKHRTDDKGLEFIFEYKVNAGDESDIKMFYDRIDGTLALVLENPGITVGEILEKLKL